VRKNFKTSRLFLASILGSTLLCGAPLHAQQFSNFSNGSPAKPNVSWTKKVTGLFTGKSSQQPIGPSVPKTSLKQDPISLGFQTAPPNAQLYLSLASVSEQTGDSQKARGLYHQALSMQPDHLEGLLALARLEDRENQLDAALHYYLQAVHLSPNSAKALNDLSLCYARRGQLTEAVAPLEHAIRQSPGKQLYRNNLAKVLVELNQNQLALQHLLAVHPPGVAHYNLGVVLHQQGRDPQAVEALSRAVSVDPNLLAARDLLAQLNPANPVNPESSAFAQQTPPAAVAGGPEMPAGPQLRSSPAAMKPAVETVAVAPQHAPQHAPQRTTTLAQQDAPVAPYPTTETPYSTAPTIWSFPRAYSQPVETARRATAAIPETTPVRQ
jgi:tetratricopeptide (TPR) repeat protein